MIQVIMSKILKPTISYLKLNKLNLRLSSTYKTNMKFNDLRIINCSKFDDLQKYEESYNISTINIENFNFNDENYAKICKIFNNNKENLKMLYMIKPKNLDKFSDILFKKWKLFENLTHFGISSYNFNKNEMELLAFLFLKTRNLNSLFLSDCIFPLNGFFSFCEYLNEWENVLKTIEISSLNTRHFDKKYAKCLSKILKSSKFLEEFSLSGSGNLGNGFMDICNSLLHSKTTLKHLTFNSCQLMANQLLNLGEILTEFKLSSICLSCNNLDLTFSTIIHGLTNSKTSMKSLLLNNCNLTEKHFICLYDFIKSANNVRVIILYKNVINYHQLDTLNKEFPQINILIA